jgi:PAS domain S-box-containing protein
VFETTRTPLVVLSNRFTVVGANHAFYRVFKTSPDVTEGRSVFRLEGRKWDVPSLRALLKEIPSKRSSFDDYEVTGHFPALGRRTMLLNARQLATAGGMLILLAIEDVTAAKEAEAALRASELRFRRIFECFQEGIILIDPVNRKILEANEFILEILGHSREAVAGKELWQVGLLGSEPESPGERHPGARQERRSTPPRFSSFSLRGRWVSDCALRNPGRDGAAAGT